jgi:hypothetical protein
VLLIFRCGGLNVTYCLTVPAFFFSGVCFSVFFSNLRTSEETSACNSVDAEDK